jgi:signal peptidase I
MESGAPAPAGRPRRGPARATDAVEARAAGAGDGAARRAATRAALRSLALAAGGAALVGLAVRLLAVEVLRVPSGAMAPSLLAGDLVVVWKAAFGLPNPLGGPLVSWGAPRRGDVVVVRHPRKGGAWIRRVVGLPGDVVEMRDGVLVVNGVPQPQEPAGELVWEEPGLDGHWWSEPCPHHLERLARGPVPPPRDGSARAGAEAWAAAERGGVLAHGVLRCRGAVPVELDGQPGRVEEGHLLVVGDNRDRADDAGSGGGWQVPIAAVQGRAVRVALRWRGGGGRPRIDRLFKPIE